MPLLKPRTNSDAIPMSNKTPNTEKDFVSTHELVMGVTKELTERVVVNVKFIHLSLFREVPVYNTSQENSRKERPSYR